MHPHHLLSLICVCVVSTGCTTLTPPVGDIFSVSGKSAAEAPKSLEAEPAPDVPSFVVEMRGSKGESQKFRRPLPEEAAYIQGVLAQSNALKHFGRVKIELWRLRPDGQGYHKLDIPYDRKNRMIPSGYDYSIREGDRLIFMKDDSTVLDDMLGSLGV